MKRLSSLLIVLAMLLVAGVASQTQTASASTVGTHLCFALDESGSMGFTNFDLERDAVADAILDPTIVPHDGSVEVAVVTFDHGAVIRVPATVVSDLATATAIHDAMDLIPYNGGGTSIAAGINRCSQALQASPLWDPTATQVINIATDGYSSTSAAITARMNAVNAGIDQVHAEAVGSGANTSAMLQIVYPQPSELVIPPAVPTDAKTIGFVMKVANFNEFAEAIKAKIQAIIPSEIQVDIDIKPNSDPSSFGCNSRGSIPVAVLGSDTFDATQIDADTVTFGVVGDETGEVHQKKGEAKRHVEDVNGDGYADMVFHFDFTATGFGCDETGDLEGNLLGNLTEDAGGTAIAGSGDIRLVGGKGK